MSILRVSAAAALLLFTIPRPAGATIVLQMDLGDNVAKSDYVVRGKVTSKENRWIEQESGRFLATLYHIEVERTLVGDDEPTTVTLMSPGGGMVREGVYAPLPAGFIDYPIGEDMVFIMEPNVQGTHTLPGLHQSIYWVKTEKDGSEKMVRAGGTATVVKSDGTPGAPLFEKTTFSSDDFDAAVKAAAEKAGKKYHEPKEKKAEAKAGASEEKPAEAGAAAKSTEVAP